MNAIRAILVTICVGVSLGASGFACAQTAEIERNKQQERMEADLVRRGHSHNDYWRKRPLMQALELGYGSIEADIFGVDGELLVGHDRQELTPKRSLRAMYVDPLVKRVQERGGVVYEKGEKPLQLLIDIKSDGEETYKLLDVLLRQHSEVFTEYRDGQVIERAITVVISGACPRAMIEKQDNRFAFVDGRKEDIEAESTTPVSLVPLFSEAWTTFFSWAGGGEMPEEQREKLQEVVRKAHAKGMTVRFWGAPQVESVWKEQKDAGVDWINVDDLERGATFLRKR
jgi:glycerophosphoryl diester phosphodiesterase